MWSSAYAPVRSGRRPFRPARGLGLCPRPHVSERSAEPGPVVRAWPCPGSARRWLGKAPGLGGADNGVPRPQDSSPPLREGAAPRQRWWRANPRTSTGGDTVSLCVTGERVGPKWTYRERHPRGRERRRALDRDHAPKVQLRAAMSSALDLLLTADRGDHRSVGVRVRHRSADRDGGCGFDQNARRSAAQSPRMETIVLRGSLADFRGVDRDAGGLTGGVQIPRVPGDHFHYTFSKILMGRTRQRSCR